MIQIMANENLDEWHEKIIIESEKFTDEFGLGACGPVADNIVNELQAAGRKARVMYTEYGKGPIKGWNRFSHYVAVELDNAGRVVRINQTRKEN